MGGELRPASIEESFGRLAGVATARRDSADTPSAAPLSPAFGRPGAARRPGRVLTSAARPRRHPVRGDTCSTD